MSLQIFLLILKLFAGLIIIFGVGYLLGILFKLDKNK